MKKNTIILFVLILIFSNCMSLYALQENRILNQLGRSVLLLIALIVSMYNNKYPRTKIVKFGYLLMFWQLLSMLGAYIVRGQGIIDSFITTCYALIYLMIPLMYIMKIDEKFLLKMCLVIGVWFAFTELIQQFTYPVYWFAARGETEEHNIEIRNGVYRFSVGGTGFGLITLFYALQKYLEKGKFKYLLLLIVGMVGIYLTCTRQVMAAAAGCILVGLYLKKKLKLRALIGIAIVGIIVYQNIDRFFGGYIEMTEGLDENYIRFIAYRYYGLEYNEGNILAFLIGNGVPRLERSSYGNEIYVLQEDLGLIRADIGLVGEYSFHGILYVITILYIFWYIFKNRKYIDLYLQLYMLYSFVTSIMLLPFRCSLGTYSTCIVLYLIDRSMTRNKKIVQEQKSRRRGLSEKRI